MKLLPRDSELLKPWCVCWRRSAKNYWIWLNPRFFNALPKSHLDFGFWIRSDEGLTLETSQLRGSFFIWFHIRSSHMIYFICIIHLHIFHGNIWTHHWPAPNVSGFIAQLVERRTGIREVTGSSPVEVLNFFQASLRNCKNCDHNCEDHSSFDFISAVHIWFISYASFIINSVDKTRFLYTTPSICCMTE